jgi:hypothetical protein
MSDTESEARRLLAAATEEVPPGIDLLGGFVAAWRRDRARRMRRRIALSAGAALAVALGTAVALTISSAPSALAIVTSALTRTLTQSYKVTEVYGGYYIRDGQVKGRYQSTCTNRADPARHLQASSCSSGPGIREVGRYTYLYFTHPAGKHWGRIPTACLGDPAKAAINGFTDATPQQMLSEIENADKVTVAGPASGPGWTGTRYAFTGPATLLLRMTGTVDVDHQGRARNLALTIRPTARLALFGVITQALTFSDFGARVTVTPPPADQTFPMPC